MKLSIAVVQFNPVRDNIKKNIRKLRRLLTGIKSDLVVLPELANTGYLYATPEDLLPLAEPQDGSGAFLTTLRELAAQTGGLIVSGYAEVAEGKLLNAAAAVTQDGVIANYRKTHLFDHEKALYSSGDTGFQIVEWQGVKIGMMICFDWIFPEAARTLALKGAQIIAHPANLVLPYCQNAMITRSIENQVFTVTANRVGKEHLDNLHLTFTGQSQVTTPGGKILYRGPTRKESVHVVEIDPERAVNKRLNTNNDLFEDRRSSLYEID
ncbi:beta-ureidopropionase [Chloroflexota bacterium]|nr:beta-ureidopropionase [Chloroflexota bacterium]